MSAPRAAMILAAGLGTRMRPLTDTCPKPLLPVAGRPMIDRVLDQVRDAGVTRAVVNLHYLGQMIRDHLAARTAPEIVFSEEQPQILETGGGIVQALAQLGPAPFFVVNSDAVWAGPNPLALLAQAWEPDRMDALLLLVRREDARNYTRAGDFHLTRNGAAPARRGTDAEAPFVYTGAQIIAPSVFNGAPSGPFSINLIWDALLAKRRLAAVTYPGAWVDVGTPDGLNAANRTLAEAEA